VVPSRRYHSPRHSDASSAAPGSPRAHASPAPDRFSPPSPRSPSGGRPASRPASIAPLRLQAEPEPEPADEEDWLGLDALSLVADAPAASPYYEPEDFGAFLSAMRLEEFAPTFKEHVRSRACPRVRLTAVSAQRSVCLQGYDDIAVLRELPEEQLVDLLLDLGMGQGHSARFRLGVRSARERPLGLTDLNELRVSATCRRAREEDFDDAEEPEETLRKVFRISCETSLAEFVQKLARVMRLRCVANLSCPWESLCTSPD